MHRLKKWLLCAGMGLLSIGMLPMNVRAEQVATFLDRPIFDNAFGTMEVRETEEEVSLSSYGTNLGASYATKYDPRTTGKVSAVEDQGNTNTCWAFAAIAAMESNLIKKGYANSNINLSENHLAYFFYNRQNDPLKNTKSDKNIPLSLSWYMRGGNSYAAGIHLASWSGVVKETVSEDDRTGAYAPKALAAGDCYKRDYVVEDAIFYNYSVKNVKKAITQYGAVSAGIGMYIDFLSADQTSYYCPYDVGNHAVTIVGWDDNYSRSNFNSDYRPTSNGAWIVKNSYGTSVHEDGYMYVSYEDASLCEILAFDMGTTATSGNNNYQYDGNAAPYTLPLPSGITYANVFQAKASAKGYNETLDAVSVNLWTSGVKYTLQVYTGLTGSKPTSGKLVLNQKGTLNNAGYCRIDLNKTVTLTYGEKYSVVLKLSAADGGNVSIGVEAPGVASSQDSSGNTISWLQFKAGVGKKKGYIKVSGYWLDCGDIDDMGERLGTLNLRIKAFTTTTNKKTTYKLSSKNLGVSKGSSSTLSLKTNPSSVKRKVTWTSSNKAVATVSSSGKVKAKSYGTATIKAKFVAGSKTKTLKCKVTVGPSKVKSFKVTTKKKKMVVTWKKSSAASGYEIYYARTKSGTYKKLSTIKSGSKTKYTKKMSAGTYYVKMRPYMNKDGKKLYGSYTSAKKVTVK